MALYNGRILMRGGNEADFDPDKMMPREWAISTDKRIVRICFAPGVCIRMATYDAFEEDMAKIEAILEESQTIEEAVEKINAEVSTNADAVVEYKVQAKQYRDEAEQFRNEAKTSAEQAEAIKNNDYNYAVNKPKINGIELQNNKTLEELNIQPRGEYCLVDNAGYSLNLSINNSNYLMTLQLLNSSGTVLSEKTIDFPIESMIVNASYLSGVLTLALQNGQTLPVNISDIISGLVNDTFKIAGIDMKNDITASELKVALELNNVPNVTTNDQTPTYSRASLRINLVSGETLAISLGKIMKWFYDLKAHAFSNPVNNLISTSTTTSLAAAQGKALNDKIETIPTIIFSTTEPSTVAENTIVMVYE